jgi:tetratricopeptide (TPR) repeat protein
MLQGGWAWVRCAVLTLSLLAGGGSARAQAQEEADVTASSAEYKELVRQALQQYTLGRWSESRVFFLKAHALSPNARTLRGLALVCYESRHYVEAIEYAEQSLTSTAQPLAPQMRTELEQLVGQARSFVGRARVVTRPEQAELRVDGKLVKPGADGTIMLDPGEHELVAAAPGHELVSRTIAIDSGDEVRFDLALAQRVDKTAPTPSDSEAAPGSDAGPIDMAALAPWLVIGASAAFVVAGGILLAMGESDRSTVNDARAPQTWDDIKGAYDRAPTLLAIGGVLLGVGIAGAATGLTWKFYLQPQAEEKGPSAKLNLTPGGVRVSGTF